MIFATSSLWTACEWKIESVFGLRYVSYPSTVGKEIAMSVPMDAKYSLNPLAISVSPVMVTPLSLKVPGILCLRETGKCQKAFYFKIGKCQNCKVSKLESVRIGKCQNWKVSELEGDWKVSESNFCPFWKKLESVRIGKCQNQKVSELESVGIEEAIRLQESSSLELARENLRLVNSSITLYTGLLD